MLITDSVDDDDNDDMDRYDMNNNMKCMINKLSFHSSYILQNWQSGPCHFVAH